MERLAEHLGLSLTLSCIAYGTILLCLTSIAIEPLVNSKVFAELVLFLQHA